MVQKWKSIQRGTEVWSFLRKWSFKKPEQTQLGVWDILKWKFKRANRLQPLRRSKKIAKNRQFNALTQKQLDKKLNRKLGT